MTKDAAKTAAKTKAQLIEELEALRARNAILEARELERQQIEDALAVCFAFNTTTRLADAFEFSMPGPEGFESGAKYLLARGYR